MAQYKDTGVLDGIVKFMIYSYLNIMDDIKIRRLVWVGHIIRMENERIAKKVLKGKLHNIRPVRKQKKKDRRTLPRGTYHKS